MAEIEVAARFDPSPDDVARLFWEMNVEEQADFFASLERMAGMGLCVQMAGVVNVIRRRAEAGDRDAQQGFQTMLNHAEAYVESATDYRAWEAQREVARMADAARITP